MENSLKFPSYHSGPLNSIKLNYSQNTIATCGNDYKINLFSTEEILKNNFSPIAELIGHDQSIWDLSFSHQKYGNFLASCSYDNKLIIWKEISKNNYQNIFSYIHQGSVNCCKFAPSEYGLIILCGISDGSISLHEYNTNTNTWSSHIMTKIHQNGVNSVDWAPAIPPINFEDTEDENENFPELNKMKFVTCGNDNTLKIFKCQNNNINSFSEEISENDNNIFSYDSVPKSVCFLNYVGYSYLTFAVGLENGKCLIYKNDGNYWVISEELNLGCPIIKVSWSSCGTYLGISCLDASRQIRFFKENNDQKWIEINK